MKAKEEGRRPVPNKFGSFPLEARKLMHEWSKLQLDKQGILKRVTRKGNDGLHYQIILPRDMRHHVYQELHVNMGHLGADRVVDMARARLTGPNGAGYNALRHIPVCVYER